MTLPASRPTRRALLAGTLALAGLSFGARAQPPIPRTRLVARFTELLDGNVAVRPVVLFNDSVAPPPLLALRQNPQILDVENASGQDLSFHGHGLRASVGVTGLEEIFVRPGETASLQLQMEEPGFALIEGRLAGSAGAEHRLVQLLIIEDDLPKSADRQVLMAFGRDIRDPGGLLVNGAAPVDLVMNAHERVHLRIANTNPLRPLAVSLEGVGGWIIGLDGFPTNEPLSLGEHPLTLLPLGRADLLIDAPVFADTATRLRATDGDGDGVSVVIRSLNTKTRPEPWPAPANPDQGVLPTTIELQKATRATFAVGETTGGNLLQSKVGEPIVLTLENATENPASISIRGQACRLLHAFDDGWEPYWLETMLLAPQTTQLIAFVPPLVGEWRIEARPIGQPQPSQVAAYKIV